MVSCFLRCEDCGNIFRIDGEKREDCPKCAGVAWYYCGVPSLIEERKRAEEYRNDVKTGFGLYGQ